MYLSSLVLIVKDRIRCDGTVMVRYAGLDSGVSRVSA